MKTNAKFNFIGSAFAFAAMLALVFSLTLFTAGKASAQGNYFNDYYISLNGGVGQTSLSGFSSKSGGTYNFSLGKNFNFNNIVIGGEATLGYAENGSLSSSNSPSVCATATIGGDSDTYCTGNTSLDSVYYSAAVKGGYAFKNIMPFVKLGYIGYSYSSSVIGSEGGFLYGAGVEYMINGNWGLTAQYFGASLSGSDRTNNYTIGVDYNF